MSEQNSAQDVAFGKVNIGAKSGYTNFGTYTTFSLFRRGRAKPACPPTVLPI